MASQKSAGNTWLFFVAAVSIALTAAAVIYARYLSSNPPQVDVHAEMWKLITGSVAAFATSASLIWTAESWRRKNLQDKQVAAFELSRRWDCPELIQARSVLRRILRMEKSDQVCVVRILKQHYEAQLDQQKALQRDFPQQESALEGQTLAVYELPPLIDIESALIMVFNYMEEIGNSIETGYADEAVLQLYLSHVVLVVYDGFGEWWKISSAYAGEEHPVAKLEKRWRNPATRKAEPESVKSDAVPLPAVTVAEEKPLSQEA